MDYFVHTCEHTPKNSMKDEHPHKIKILQKLVTMKILYFISSTKNGHNLYSHINVL